MPKINELTAATALTATDVLAMDNTSGTATRKVTGQQIKDFATADVNAEVADLKNATDYIDQTVYNERLGATYSENTISPSGSSWTNFTIISGLNLEAGKAYKISIKSNTAFDVGAYARIYNGSTELTVSRNLSGVQEYSWFYTPTQNYTGCDLKIQYGSTATFTIIGCVSSDAFGGVDNNTKAANNLVFGENLGVNYLSKQLVVGGKSAWTYYDIIPSIDLKAGYKYTVLVQTNPAFTVGGYVKFLTSGGTELSASSSLNGKSEVEWTYTPTQDISGAAIKIGYGSTDTYTLVCIVSYTGFNNIDMLQKQMSMTTVPYTRLRRGTASNASNTYAVSTPVIKTTAKHIEIINTRPNRTNCVYQYYIYTATKPIDDLASDSSARSGYAEPTWPYYTLSDDGRCGVQIAICEYNKSRQSYTDFETLLPSDFEKYPIFIYEYDDVPYLYGSYLDQRIGTIKSRDIGIGNSGDSFIFITDQHQRPNDYISPYLAKRIIRNSSVRRLIYGGDYINQPDSKDVAITQLTNAINSDDVVPDAIFLQGNHETNPYGTGNPTEGELYGILTRRVERFLNTGKKNYYYFDNQSQKIRYFVLNTGEDGNIDSTQVNWFKSNAESLDSSWNIIILSHMALQITTSGGRNSVSLYGVVSSIATALTNVNATVCCWICGHTHVDQSDTTSYSFPIICTTCDSDSQGTWFGDNRDAYTINRGAFDVFHVDTANHKVYATRIGGGENNVLSTGDLTDNDREWTYTA